MKKDHRPYYIKKAYVKFQKFYVNHFLRPQFESLGKGFTFMKPWNVEIFGPSISLGDYATVIATSDKKVRLSVWSDQKDKGGIRIGDCCLISPGVRISSASGIVIENNCMIASDAYITDSDWHDIYNRTSLGKSEPVRIRQNAWIGDSVIICKGVNIGENSIVGAGAVVVKNIPANTVAAGNPARVVKHLDPGKAITTRTHWFSDPAGLSDAFDRMDKDMLQNNSLLHWLRYLLFPAKKD